MNKKETLILGVGNPLRRDDGIGPKIISLLSEDETFTDLSSGYELADGGTDGLGLIEYFRTYKKVILIDAVEMGMKPGSVKIFTPPEASIQIDTDSLSTHGFGIPELIKLSIELGILPELTIVGIQPYNTGYGEELSEMVKTSINIVLAYFKMTN